MARRGWKWLRGGGDESLPADAFTAAEDHEDELWDAPAEPEALAEPEVADEPALADDVEDEDALAEPEAAPIAPALLFGAPGKMDEDGFSEARSYSEKADAERALLATIERRLDDARAQFDTLKADALRGYADDLRARIARFEALAAEAANRAA